MVVEVQTSTKVSTVVLEAAVNTVSTLEQVTLALSAYTWMKQHEAPQEETVFTAFTGEQVTIYYKDGEAFWN